MKYAVLEGDCIKEVFDNETKEIPEGAVFFSEEDFEKYLESLRG